MKRKKDSCPKCNCLDYDGQICMGCGYYDQKRDWEGKKMKKTILLFITAITAIFAIYIYYPSCYYNNNMLL